MLSTYVDQIVPAAVISLNRMAQAIDAYLSISPVKVDSTLLTLPDDASPLNPNNSDSTAHMGRGGSAQDLGASTNE